MEETVSPLAETRARILDAGAARAERGVFEQEHGLPVRCYKCRDTGWVEITVGNYRTVGSTLNPEGTLVEASEGRPGYQRCRCSRETPDAADQPARRELRP